MALTFNESGGELGRGSGVVTAPRELFIWDLATDTRIPLRINMSTMCWLDATQFAVFDGTVLDPHYVVVRARDGKVLSASLSEYSAKDLNQVETLLRTQWQSRQQTFVLSNFFFSGYTIVVIKDDQPSVVYLDLGGGIENEQRIASLLANIPHTRIPDLCYYPGIDAEGSPIALPSPDGRLVARENNALTEISITDQSGRLVAAIRRDGWNPNLLGWAHDSSGVYVQFFSRGSAAALTMSWKPIFKLAPLSPQEELLSWLAWLGGWGGAGWRRLVAAALVGPTAR